MEEILCEVLSNIAGGRVLDVATAEGGFVRVLVENLASYSEIVGVDASAHAIETARGAFDQENVRFLQMDAARLDFDDECFDTVSLSASLHHIKDIPQVLAEIVRVLKPGGRFILAEMHRDGRTEAQLTFIYLHHWVAAVDSALGIVHYRTLARQEFIDYVAGMGLRDVAVYDLCDTDADTRDEAATAPLEGLVERVLQRARDLSNYAALERRGEELRRRLYETGAQREPAIVIVGSKPR